MPILKSATTPNGIACNFHKAVSGEVIFDSGIAIIGVHSWVTEADYLAGKNVVWVWRSTVPLAQLADFDAFAVEAGDFTGGSVVADAANTLEAAKLRAWAGVKNERASRMLGTFDHAGNTFDIDPVNLSGASIDAREALIAGEAWSQMWVLADNSVITLTAAEMIALARAAKTVVSNLWGTSQYLRGLIEAATTIPEVEAITWP